MTACVDLELSIRRHDDDSYALELRYSQPGSEVEPRYYGRLELGEAGLNELRALTSDPEAYGARLGEMLWNDRPVGDAVTDADSVAETRDVPLRFRLYIDPGLTELHALRWETMSHPRLGTLATNERVLFSRYLPSMDNRPVALRPHTDLRALIFIANPGGLKEQYDLTPIDVPAELERARAGLAGLPVTEVAESGTGHLNALIDALRPGIDILYLVAHGAFRNGRAMLLLETEDDPAKPVLVDGADLVERIQGLARRPSLVVLSSCQSAGTGDDSDEALSALGPALTLAGVPAVVAMQGQIEMSTVARLMPAFFEQLKETGQVDHALAVARARIRHDRPDWWMPVLYMNLKNGRIGWYAPGFGGGDERAAGIKWRGLRTSIRGEKCTPILGIGLLESWFGSRRVMAQAWADTHGFPLSAADRDDLPQVAQYLAVTEKSSDIPRYDFIDYIYKAIWERYESVLGDAFNRHDEPDPEDLNRLMVTVWESQPVESGPDPYTVLAQLKMPIYLTADPSDLLLRALEAQPDCHPRVLFSPWNGASRDLNYDYRADDEDQTWEPSAQEPLVYYLFGRLAEPDTLVITEDDYFDYLIQMTRYREDIPHYVGGALTRTALLILGFRFDDWDFRAFFRILMNQSGKLSDDKPHIAAQLEPNEQAILEPDGAKAYLQQYMQSASIDIFWGRTVDFFRSFQAHTGGRS